MVSTQDGGIAAFIACASAIAGQATPNDELIHKFGLDSPVPPFADSDLTAAPYVLPEVEIGQGYASAMPVPMFAAAGTKNTHYLPSAAGTDLAPDFAPLAKPLTHQSQAKAQASQPEIEPSLNYAPAIPAPQFADSGLLDPLDALVADVPSPLYAPVTPVLPVMATGTPGPMAALPDAPERQDYAPGKPVSLFADAGLSDMLYAPAEATAGSGAEPVSPLMPHASGNLIDVREAIPAPAQGSSFKLPLPVPAQADVGMAEPSEDQAAASPGQTMPRTDPGQQAILDRLNRLEEQLQSQRVQLSEQAGIISSQQKEIEALRQQGANDAALAVRARGTGNMVQPLFGMQAATAPATSAAPAALAPVTASGRPAMPPQPVGEAPAEAEPRVERVVTAVPEGLGVLTPKGRFVYDPSFEYSRSSTNRLVFRGFELIPGIQIGVIEATDADRDTLAHTSTLRYGLTNRLEIEARVPVLYRHDRIEVVQQRDQGIVRSIELSEGNIGDAEFAIRYQLNRPKGAQQPIFVGSVRVKSDTGKGPFDVGYDTFGVATGLATGSGFWAVQPGLNFLLPSDPAVIYGSASYVYHIPRNVNRIIGGAFVGRVDPGDAVSASLGFGFALNPRFSFSLGYGHTYIFPSKQEIGGTLQRSKSLQVGSFNFGMSYRLSQKQTMNASFELGATSDAPDMSFTLRFPFSFGGGGR